jgi:hypothetical protein
MYLSRAAGLSDGAAYLSRSGHFITMTKTPPRTMSQRMLSIVKRGLSAYVSYLAACEMNQAFSEYVLYEPILRILMTRGYSVQCEYVCPGIPKRGLGDSKRLDFYAVGHSLDLAIEVKWVKSAREANSLPCCQTEFNSSSMCFFSDESRRSFAGRKAWGFGSGTGIRVSRRPSSNL